MKRRAPCNFEGSEGSSKLKVQSSKKAPRAKFKVPSRVGSEHVGRAPAFWRVRQFLCRFGIPLASKRLNHGVATPPNAWRMRQPTRNQTACKCLHWNLVLGSSFF